MSALPSLASTQADFSTVADFDGRGITLHLRGTADMRSRQALDTVLSGVHAEAKRLSVGDVRVDMNELEFMNSSCFKNFITWINLLQKMEPTARYRVVFVSNPTIYWQRRSLSALQSYGAGLITIEP